MSRHHEHQTLTLKFVCLRGTKHTKGGSPVGFCWRDGSHWAHSREQSSELGTHNATRLLKFRAESAAPGPGRSVEETRGNPSGVCASRRAPLIDHRATRRAQRAPHNATRHPPVRAPPTWTRFASERTSSGLIPDRAPGRESVTLHSSPCCHLCPRSRLNRQWMKDRNTKFLRKKVFFPDVHH